MLHAAPRWNRHGWVVVCWDGVSWDGVYWNGVSMRCDRRHLLSIAAGALGTAAFAARATSQPSTAAPSPPTPSRAALRLGLISDLNSSYGSTTYIPTVHQGLSHLLALDPALVVCAGDMVAGQKRGLNAAQLGRMWDGFARDVLQPVRRQGVPFLPAIGNHDGAPGFTTDRSIASQFWQARHQGLGLNFVASSGFPFHYSVLDRNVFWLVWDASSSRIPTDQLNWARQQLASPQARNAGLRLVVGHLPLYGLSQGRDRPGEVLHQAAAIQALLEDGNVQAYISGHQHAWFPARSGTLDLIQLGALGSGPRRLVNGNLPARQTLTTLDVDWSAGTMHETSYAANNGQPLAWTTLPQQLTGHRGVLKRNRPLRSL
ncbi:MAG: metallophosphoesterase family protein [Synechococcus sp.]